MTKKVDTVPEMMKNDFGTAVLITQYSAEKWLQKSTALQKYSQFCGGKGGWDDFSERIDD